MTERIQPTEPGPIVTLRCPVRAEWIDVNGHVNATHYGLIIYDAHVVMTAMIGMDQAYIAGGFSKVVASQTIVYERELLADSQVEVRSWLLAVDPKRMHWFHELWCIDGGFRAATGEQLDLHVDLNQRKVAAMSEEQYQYLAAVSRTQTEDGLPAGVGRVVGMPKACR